VLAIIIRLLMLTGARRGEVLNARSRAAVEAVKSRKFNLRVELPSRFRRFENKQSIRCRHSASKHRRQKAIEKTIPRIFGQRDFSHSLDPQLTRRIAN
jgi:hypothetical protein